MAQISHDKSLDSTLTFLNYPYRFIAKRCQRYQVDVFETRLLLEKALCITGPAASQLFYDPSRFLRQGAIPRAIKKTLLGQSGVQGLDDLAHRHRKRLLMPLMTPAQISRLAETSAGAWQAATQKWTRQGEVVLTTRLVNCSPAPCASRACYELTESVRKGVNRLSISMAKAKKWVVAHPRLPPSLNKGLQLLVVER